MESSVDKGYDHACSAATATLSANSTVAISEHALAAGEFSHAMGSTGSAEAQRTLRLLEQHHRRLAQLLQLPNEGGRSRDEVGAAVIKATAQSGHLPSLVRSNVPRESPTGSSIATKLASARGIRAGSRAQPVAPSMTPEQAPGSVEVPRDVGNRRMQSMLEPQGLKRSATVPAPVLPPTSAPAQEGYSRFYSAFGSLLTRISAPLAFTGLPLPEAKPPAAKTEKAPHVPSSEPDLGRIYSKATLRTVQRDDYHANESFYVVPTSGHTMSYASVVADRDPRHTPDNASIASDGLASDSHSRFAPASAEMSHANQELYAENRVLKETLDKLTKRLHAFEASAQSSSMAALAQSMRFNGNEAPSRDDNRHPSGALEQQLASAQARIDALERDNEKMQRTLARYRERWDKLKESAKARRAIGASTEEEGVMLV